MPTTDSEHPDIVITPLYLREKKGGHMTYSPSHLFGQPLLIGLPKHNLTYESLYDKALNSLSRYVTPPAEGKISSLFFYFIDRFIIAQTFLILLRLINLGLRYLSIGCHLNPFRGSSIPNNIKFQKNIFL